MLGSSQVAQWYRIHLPIQETQEMCVWSLSRGDALKQEMATHFSILAGKISWTEEPSSLQSIGSQRVGLWLNTHANKQEVCYQAAAKHAGQSDTRREGAAQVRDANTHGLSCLSPAFQHYLECHLRRKPKSPSIPSLQAAASAYHVPGTSHVLERQSEWSIPALREPIAKEGGTLQYNLLNPRGNKVCAENTGERSHSFVMKI